MKALSPIMKIKAQKMTGFSMNDLSRYYQRRGNEKPVYRPVHCH